MSKQIKLPYLLGAFCLLLFIFLISLWVDHHKGEKTFRTELASFDTAKVYSVIITENHPVKKEVTLTKETQGWKVFSGGKSWNGDANMIRNLLQDLAQLQAQQIVATSSSQWKEFSVDDSAGLHVLVEGKRHALADITIGRFSYQPPVNPYDRQGTAISYLRVGNEEPVYAVNGFLRFSLNPDPASFRDKNLIAAEKQAWTRLQYTYPGDSSFVLEKQTGGWKIGGTPVDSVRTSEFIGNLEKVMGYDFADSAWKGQNPVYTLLLEQKGSKSVEIKAYPADTTNHFVLYSSSNPGSYFSGKNGLTERIFKGKSYFLHR